MFTDVTKRRNPQLIQSAVALHQSGKIPPNTYVVDLDAVAYNVAELSKASKQHGVQLYFMTKQIGRSGFIGNWIAQHGIEKAVAVDFDEAQILANAKVQIGHIGHIVQPGMNQWLEVLENIRPEVVTLFSLERARQLSAAAQKLGKVQDVILRVIKPGDYIYDGQFGGFLLDQLEQQLPALQQLKGIRVIGLTTFPLLKINEQHTDFMFTDNLNTLKQAKTVLEANGIQVLHMNGPSATCCDTIPMLREAGITHGEPGHAITGTTPLHATRDLAEQPAMIYVTEVSHTDANSAYVLGGGFYSRSNTKGAFVSSQEEHILDRFLEAKPYSSDFIDYYGELVRDSHTKVGDTVVYAFRTQIFVTRANVAYVRNVGPDVEVIYFQRRGF